jgi:hypothetical protein
VTDIAADPGWSLTLHISGASPHSIQAIETVRRVWEAELGRCDRGVLRHHCPGHNFSDWVTGVFHDKAPAVDLAAA